MENKLISFETAKLAKEVGLEDKEYSTDYYFPDGRMDFSLLIKNPAIRNEGFGFYAPSQSLLQKWLRDTHNIDVAIYPGWVGNRRVYEITVWKESIEIDVKPLTYSNDYGRTSYEFDYEKSLEKGLLIGLKQIQNGK